MASLYADEDFRYGVVERLRGLGYDVLTVQEAGRRGSSDTQVLADATAAGRAVLTHNRWHFERLHRHHPAHAGIISSTDDNDLDHAFACTHAALNRLTAENLSDDLSGKALFIDEAHHASADGLSEIVNLWRARGGQLFFFTATPYRGDGRPVKLDGMRSFRRSLAEHMAEGFAPRHLESEIVALGKPGSNIKSWQPAMP